MRSTSAALVAATALATSLAACSAGNSPICTTVPVKNVSVPQLIYPMPKAVSVPLGALAMVVAYPGAPALAQTLTLATDSGVPRALGPMGAVPNPLPTPHAKAGPGAGAEYGVTLPKLEPNTHYTVAYRYASSAGLCGTSTTQSVTMGSFTTGTQ